MVGVDARLERAEETAHLIREEGGIAIAIEADATCERDMQQVIDQAVFSLGRLDVMHNNVGGGGASGTPDTTTWEEWNREIAVSLNSAYLGIRCAVPVMLDQSHGVITNTSSFPAVRFLRRPNVAYTASKAAVEAMTRSCAGAYGPNHALRPYASCSRPTRLCYQLIRSGRVGTTRRPRQSWR